MIKRWIGWLFGYPLYAEEQLAFEFEDPYLASVFYERDNHSES